MQNPLGGVPRALTAALGLAVILALTACGGEDVVPTAASVTTQTPTNVLVTVQAEPAGAHCDTGGSRVQAGLDTSGDGTLDSGEVTSTQYICNGETGATGASGATGATGTAGTSALAAVTDAGSHCANGGKAISVGSDTNGNGVLDAGEIVSTDYVCNGATGAQGTAGTNGTDGTNGTNGSNGHDTLLVSIAESAGANCAWGGMKTTSGLDANGNHVLDASEVTSTTYVCNGKPAALANVVDVTGTSVVAASNTSYLADNGGTVTVTLPASPAVGDLVRVSGAGKGGWQIAQGAGQSVYVGFANTAWSFGPANNFSWNTLGTSGNGRVIAAVGYNMPAEISLDGGATWSASSSDSQNWVAVALSQDGSRILIAGYGTGVQMSTNAGATWQYTALPSNVTWAGVAVSPDGQHMAAAMQGGGIYTSADGGANWSPTNAASLNWQGLAQSADGTHLIAPEFNGSLWVSTDGGATWNAATGPGTQYWRSVTSSDDGMHMAATASYSVVYTSSDAGSTWTARPTISAQWAGLTSSSDGSHLAAAEQGGMQGGYIYTSTDYGAHWSRLQGAGVSDWQSLSGSADGLTLSVVGNNQIQVAHAATVAGTSGGLAGGAFDSVTLQYDGGGLFAVIEAAGTLQVP
jgi:photosystem II stability/assembly factor-like uncharacterized protein